MANTIKNATLLTGLQRNIVYTTILYVDAQATNQVIYDSSAIATTLGITDPLTCTLLSIKYSSNSAAGLFRLNWDATSPVVAWSLPYQGNEGEYCFKDFGGLKNQGGTGITGDITLTTTGLTTGESLSITLEVRPN